VLLQLKKDFLVVKELREKSGWGWDASCHVVVAPDSAWDELIHVSQLMNISESSLKLILVIRPTKKLKFGVQNHFLSMMRSCRLWRGGMQQVSRHSVLVKAMKKTLTMQLRMTL